jgi:hypothetical protein
MSGKDWGHAQRAPGQWDRVAFTALPRLIDGARELVDGLHVCGLQRKRIAV